MASPHLQNPSAQNASGNIALSPGQAKFLYWFVGTAPILKAMTTITTYLGSRKAKLKELAKLSPLATKLTKDAYTDIYRNVVSDFARQTVTCSFQLMSYFLVGTAIKAILKHIYAKKPVDQQNPGMQQVLMQVIPLSVQVLATVLSRNYGAADLQALFNVDAKTGKYLVHGKQAKGFWEWPRQYIGPFIEKHLTTPEGCLRPLKASVLATGAMVGYFAALVGVLYGLSSGRAKAFPNSKQPKKAKPVIRNPEIRQPYFPVSPVTVGKAPTSYPFSARTRVPFSYFSASSRAGFPTPY